MEKNSRIYPAEISDEELSSYSYNSFGGKIILVDTFRKFRQVIPGLKSEGVFGFDTETKPSFKKGRKNKVALIQLSTASHAYLFRLNLIGLPEALAGLLSDGSIVKAGVAVRDDLKVLQDYRKFEPAGFIDLQTIARQNGIMNISLKKLSAIVLGFRISKRQQVTDWEAAQLTEAQLLYAATDAWICHEIYRELSGNGLLSGKETTGI
ncbi:MAG: 3'-5' exonuclease [Bacteroidales bacterium]|jgi:ribonuclease D|nr:3'-5' exonuclease [Bacteroidales bacterium]